MANQPIQIAGSHGAQPPINLNRLGPITTYEVMDYQLRALDQIVARENQALSFASLALGTFVSTTIGWLTAQAPTPRADAIYFSATAISGIAALWFGVVWFREKKNRPTLLAEIRQGGLALAAPNATP